MNSALPIGPRGWASIQPFDPTYYSKSVMTLDSLADYFDQRFPAVLSALPLAAAVGVGGLFLLFVLSRLLSLVASRTSLSDLDVQPVRRILRWLVIFVTVLLVAGVFGFELGGVWAFMSTVLAMVAIGFVAVWSLLSNTSATVILLFTRPFQIGDHIELKSENIAGRVVDLNFFFATLQVDQHTTYQVPNNLFFQKVIRRMAGPYHHSLAQQLSSTYPAVLPPFPYAITDSGAMSPPVSAANDAAMKAIPDPATLSPGRK
jgi:hypothetical protein